MVSALGLGGCATLRLHPGFTDVEKLVAERTAAKVAWRDGGPADAEVADRIKATLAKELTSDAAVQVALLNNRKLQVVYQNLGIAEADLAQAGLLPNPVLNADVRFGVGVSGTGADIGVVQEFLSVLQIPLRKRAAGAAFEAAKLEVARAVFDLASEVKSSFYRLQGALQMLELRRTVANATAGAAELVKRQREVGNTTDLDVATERTLAEQAKIELAEAEVEVEADREEFNALLGLWGDQTTWTIGSRLPELPKNEISPQGLEAAAVKQRLDLAAARQEIEVLAQTLALTRSYGLVPGATLGAAAQREVEGGAWSLGPSIGIPIPIFDQRQATMASYTAQIQRSRERYTALAVDIRADVRKARARLLGARAEAEYYRRVVLPLRHEVVRQTQLQYNGMQVGVFQLLQARRDEIEAGRAYIAALTNYWTTRAELERAVGGELRLEDGAPKPVSLPAEAPESPTIPQQHHHGG